MWQIEVFNFDSNVMITIKIVYVGLSALEQELSCANVERKTEAMSKLLEEILSDDNIALAIK